MGVFDTSIVIGVESLLHGTRLIVEHLREVRYRSDAVDVIGFQFFCTSVALRQVIGSWLEERLDDGVDVSGALIAVACVLPSIALAFELVIMRLFSFAVVVSSLLLLVDPCIMRIDVSIVLFLCLELHGGQLRSNLLRLLALLALLVSAYLPSPPSRYVAILGLELASWATERYMLPWRITASETACCGALCRFILGFLVGVHIINGEEPVLMRPCRRAPFCFPETIRGISVYNGDVFARYRASPMGVLFAYVEGLGLVPYRFCRDDDGRINLYFLGVHLLQFETVGWANSSLDDSFAAASRFPFRRLLLGVLLRTSTMDTSGLLFMR